jgi:hypothetical protein
MSIALLKMKRNNKKENQTFQEYFFLVFKNNFSYFLFLITFFISYYLHAHVCLPILVDCLLGFFILSIE